MEKSVGEETQTSNWEAMEVDAGSRSMTEEVTTGEEHPEKSTEEVTTGAPCEKKRKIAEQEQETELDKEIKRNILMLDEEIERNRLEWINSPPILDPNIENRAGCMKIGHSGNVDLKSMDPEKEFYLVDALPMPGKRNYYKHLIVNNSSTREKNFNFNWSIDPETDRQYVSFYSKLEECISDKVPSWKGHVSGCLDKDEEFLSKKRDYEAKALEIGKKPEFSKLGSYDIYNCILELIKEKSLIRRRLELSKGYLFCLLDCNQEEEISDLYDSWVHDGKHLYLKTLAVRNFKNWLNQPGIRQMTKLGRQLKKRKLS